MIGPGGYAELEMDDAALEGGAVAAPAASSWVAQQQQAAITGTAAPLAPTVGAAGTGVYADLFPPEPARCCL